jgi:hypothetical protein
MSRRKSSVITTSSPRSTVHEILTALRSRVGTDKHWTEKLNALEGDPVQRKITRIHLAVFIEPYLQYVLDGTKTVESRFSINRCAPFERARPGDIILLKKSGGGVIGACQITHSWFYRLDPSAWKFIKEKFAGPLAIKDASFWKAKERACYASLLKIAHVYTFDPLPVHKRDRRGWVILGQPAQQQLPLT